MNFVCLVGFLSLLGRFWNFLRISLNDVDWLEDQISRFFQIRFSGKAVCVVWLVLVLWFSLIRDENQSPFVFLDL